MRSVGLLALLLAVRCEALLSHQLAAHVSRAQPAPRRAALSALAPAEAIPLLSASLDSVASASLDHTSVLLSEGFLDVLQGFADSPAILLIPIGAGATVASIIIFILVKSAG